MSNRKHTLESVKKEAKKYTTRGLFSKGSPGAYNWAQKHKKLDEVCSSVFVYRTNS